MLLGAKVMASNAYVTGIRLEFSAGQAGKGLLPEIPAREKDEDLRR